MKRIFFAFSILCLGAFRASGQTIGPRIQFDTTTIDLGEVHQGQDIAFDFWFTNVGDEPLTLSMVKNTCGCNPARWTSFPVPPRGRGLIHGYYDSKHIGTINKSLLVTCNDPQNDTIFLFERGMVLITPAETNVGPRWDKPWPKEIELPLGTISIPNEGNYFVRMPFENRWIDNINVLYIDCDPGLKVTDWTKGLIRPYQYCYFDAWIVPEIGRFSRGLRITTDSPIQPEVFVTISGEFTK